MSGSVFDIPEKELRIRELDKESQREGFWDDQERASGILREKSRLTDAVEKWKRQKNNLDDLRILSEIASEEQDDQIQLCLQSMDCGDHKELFR